MSPYACTVPKMWQPPHPCGVHRRIAGTHSFLVPIPVLWTDAIMMKALGNCRKTYIIPHMGHELSDAVCPTIVSAIVENARSAENGTATQNTSNAAPPAQPQPPAFAPSTTSALSACRARPKSRL